MVKYITILMLTLSSVLAAGQESKFYESGQVEYEKTINLHVIAKKMKLDEPVYEAYKNGHDQFFKTNSTLMFSGKRSLFMPSGNSVSQNVNVYNGFTFPFSEQANTVYMDFASNLSVKQKKLSEKRLLISDTIVPVKWRITDEFREILGFSCRRANGIVMDSVYVVAFYTDQIHLQAGPESFNGLPGLILQVALPHQNVTWKAISIKTDINAVIEKPDGGEKVDAKKLIELINLELRAVRPSWVGLMQIDLSL